MTSDADPNHSKQIRIQYLKQLVPDPDLDRDNTNPDPDLTKWSVDAKHFLSSLMFFFYKVIQLDTDLTQFYGEYKNIILTCKNPIFIAKLSRNFLV